MKLLFVTGAPRTGTTLLDKMLSMHPSVEVLSQPLPLLYVELKSRFLRERRHLQTAGGYPLNDMFLANHYPPSEFVSFLESRLVDVRLCAYVLRCMISYPGQYTKPSDPFFYLRHYQACALDEYVAGYCRRLRGTSKTAVVGAKESFCEEFIPYFLTRGAFVLQLIRDPRDSIASMLTGQGATHAGAARPLLFYIRQWRKSAAFALAHARRPRYWLLKYESLTADPVRSLAPVVQGLGVEPFEPHAFGGDLKTSSGDVWYSNSSHQPVRALSQQSVGVHASLLSQQVSRLIQACCYHEMIALGYAPQIEPSELRAALAEYAESAPPIRPELAAYHWSPEREREEHLRLDALEGRRFAGDLFIFDQAFQALIAKSTAPP